MAKRLKAKRAMLGSLMHLSTKAFNRHIEKKLLPKANIKTDRALTLIALEVDKNIMIRWPVATGRSRAAWSVYLKQKGVPEPGLTGEQSQNFSGEGASIGKDEGDAVEKFRGVVKEIRLINGVDYSPWLEVGASKQAPAGVVRIVLLMIRRQTGEVFTKQYKGVR